MRLKNVKGANEIIIKGTYYVDDPYINKGNWDKVFNNNNDDNDNLVYVYSDKFRL